MQYMVIERFKDAKEIYERLRDRGRLMPDGLVYVNSWISTDLGRCFQVMETDDCALFDSWIASWNDVMEFEVVPVVSSAEASALALPG
jgi:hypothetical protein